MNKKMFVFDLDGTLLNKKSEISSKNLEALKKAKQKGNILVAATGRNYLYAQLAIGEHWDLFNYYLGCNSGIIHNIPERIYSSNKNKIDFDFLQIIDEEVREERGTVQVSTMWNVFIGFYIEDKTSPIIKWHLKEKFFDPYPSIDEMQEKDKESIILISVHLDENKVRYYQQRWSEKYGDKFEFAITSRFNIDINPKGVNKLAGIKTIVEKENIEYDNVFVFGDTQNDIKGLEYYNNTYAMDNALPEVKNAAKYIIGDNDTNDIAKIVLKNI